MKKLFLVGLLFAGVAQAENVKCAVKSINPRFNESQNQPVVGDQIIIDLDAQEIGHGGLHFRSGTSIFISRSGEGLPRRIDDGARISWSHGYGVYVVYDRGTNTVRIGENVYESIYQRGSAILLCKKINR